jgi:hypothetical protein
MINALCFAGLMVQYIVWRAVFSIVEFVMWHIGKGVNSRIPVSETYPFTEEAIIV